MRPSPTIYIHTYIQITTVICQQLVFLVIKKVCDPTWHSGLLYKLLAFSTGLTKLIACIIANRKFTSLVEDKFFTAREIATGIPQGFLHIDNFYMALGTHLVMFAGDMCILDSEA
jgi:hypothetical protein